MELLLFVLFMLFSIVSSLLERRKRKRELESARQAEAARPQSAEFEEQEEVNVGWPFGGGKDPFEDEELTRRFGDLQRLGEKADEPESGLIQVMEQETAPEPTSSSQTQVRDALASAKKSVGGSARAVRYAGRLRIDARKAREAIVYSEILGLPKAMRTEER